MQIVLGIWFVQVFEPSYTNFGLGKVVYAYHSLLRFIICIVTKLLYTMYGRMRVLCSMYILILTVLGTY